MDHDSEIHVAQDLLLRAHSPPTAKTIFDENVKLRTLHLHPSTCVAPSDPQQARRQLREQRRRLKKIRPHPLSSRQKKALQLYDIPASEQKYSLYEPLNRLWNGYLLELLNGDDRRSSLPITRESLAKVCSADLHGAKVLVVRSGCPNRVGVGGIVVKDLRGAFEVITKASKVKTLPKEGTIFQVKVRLLEGRPNGKGQEDMNSSEPGDQANYKPMLQHGELIFEIHGDQIICRAADRATKKFRWHFRANV